MQQHPSFHSNHRLLILLLFFLVGKAHAQTTASESLLEKGCYRTSLPALLNGLARDPNNALLNFQVGSCYLYSRSLSDRAIPYLKEAVHASVGKDSLQLASLIALGDVYLHTWDYEKAAACYTAGVAIKKGARDKDTQVLLAALDVCRTQIERAQLSPCNTPPDVLDRRYFEQAVLDTNRLSIPMSDEHADTLAEECEATLGTSDDHQLILIYSPDSMGYHIFTANLMANRWSTPIALLQALNTQGWEPQETITSDASLLFFVSDRKGGYGGLDIYFCRKETDGSWSKAINAGPYINSAGNDFAPFIHPDGKLLYFSSNRNKPQGGYQVFASTLKSDSSFSLPINIGYPKSTSSKVLSAKTNKEDGHKAPFLTKNSGAFITRFSDQSNTHFVLMQGAVKSAKAASAVQANIGLHDCIKDQCAGLFVLSTDTLFSALIPSCERLSITYKSQNQLFVSQALSLNDSTTLSKADNSITFMTLEKGVKEELANLFFEADLPTLLPASNTELQNIADMLNAHPSCVIELEVVTPCYTKGPMANELVKARAQSLGIALNELGHFQNRIKCIGRLKKQPTPSKASNARDVQPTITLSIVR